MSDAPQLADVSGVFPESFSRAFDVCCGFVLTRVVHVATPSAAGSGLIAIPQSARG